jgi:hypothetical protein
LAPFQILIYTFPTILFFVSLIARVILKFTANKNLGSTLSQFANELIEEINKESIGSTKVDTKKIISNYVKNKKNEDSKKEASDLEEKDWNNSHFLFSFFIDSFMLSIANGVIIMFQSLDIFYGFILLFVGIIMSVFGFALIFTSRLSWATFLLFMIILVLFIPEMLFLITLSFYWFYLITLIIAVILGLIIIIEIATEEVKKRRGPKSPENI